MQRILQALMTFAVAGHAAAVRAVPELQLPYTFEANQGQADPAVRYLARGKGYTLYLTGREAVVALKKRGAEAQALRMSLRGGRTPEAIEGLDANQARSNYFIGSTARDWRLNVPHYSRVRYRGVYEGIDAIYHSTEGRLEYDFLVAPGASASQIALRFEGARKVRVNRAGELELVAEGGTLKHRRPVAYQEIAGERHIVPASYELRDGVIRFQVGEYDRSQPLVIDPVVVYSTYLGGGGVDSVNAVAADKDGNVYVAGETTSLDYPVVGTALLRPAFALTYGFVTKINAAGDRIVYSTYLGGSSSTRNLAIQVDAAGSVYLGGVTGARDFPLANATQNTQPGLNIGFVAKLSAAGDRLLFSTYIGGERNDRVDALAIDAQGSIYVTGYATSTTLPVVNAFQSKLGGSSDALVAKWTAPDYRLTYSSYLGGTGEEDPYGIVADSTGAAYVTGFTYSSNLATAGSYQTKMLSSGDAYVARIAPAGALGFFTYLGGDNADHPQAIALDRAGNLLITGSTSSKNFPVTADAVQKELRGYVDAFVTRMDAAGTRVLYSTYLGGTQATGTQFLEEGRAIAADPQNNIVVAGVTNSADFPAVRQIQPYGGNTDAFVTVLNPAGDKILYSTFIGGSKEELAHGMAVDAAGAVYVGGQTQSSDLALKNPIRSAFGGSQEGFLTKICDPSIILGTQALSFVKLPGAAQPAAQTVTVGACAAIPFTVAGSGAFLKVTPTGGTTNATLTATVDASGLQPGEYKGSITVTAADATNSPQTIAVTLTVAPPPPAITAAGIVNAASGKGGALSPGELVVIYGSNVGPEQLAGLALNGDMVVTQIANTRVLFDGVPGPMIYAAGTQVSAVVPYAMANRSSFTVEVERFGVRSNAVTMNGTPSSPALFTVNSAGFGQGAILNQDGSLNGEANGASAGQVVILFGTGEGQTNPGGIDGKLASQSLPKPMQSLQVKIGNQTAEVLYAGAAPGMVAGVMQVNVKVPAGVAPGSVPVQVSVGSAESPVNVTMTVR